MADSSEAMYFDVDHILTEEEVAELYYDFAENMQDLGMDYYDSKDEIMQHKQGEDQGQHNTDDTQSAAGFQEMEQPIHHGTQQKQRKQLTMKQRREIVDSMLVNMQQGNLPRGNLKQLSVNFNVHKSTITRIFADIKKQMAQGSLIDAAERSYAATLKISHSSLHNLKIKGRLRTHTSTNKPALTSDHKVARLKWILSHINPVASNKDPTFVDMNHVIHKDEKWFYLNPDKRRFYLQPSEEDPYRPIQPKRFKLKAMFICLIGKPLYDTDGGLLHDGKYGMFPFTVKQLAKKSSKNRVAGTWETKAIQNVNRDVIRDMLVANVIPAIISKWPNSQPKNIVIQWDNTRPHQVPTDAEFMAATTAHEFNIQFVFQPP
ncbi:uncharacterized protein LOC110711917 [Chenopodium quinoa]|uniref:uncharacterized protein LOC110711917 n=1 Tax=Chenopodium quinoa TaxID=63459 RepID=UPI000B76C481|nr:uncharacterized protein LOC110711917 [Chenopodium quinoa]